jgi:hypothetical protein
MCDAHLHSFHSSLKTFKAVDQTLNHRLDKARICRAGLIIHQAWYWEHLLELGKEVEFLAKPVWKGVRWPE